MEITKAIYRDALHVYLKYAYPDDDEQYYSKWAWLVPSERFFDERMTYENHYPKCPDGFPNEARFGCHCSGNTKLRCYVDGFMFDTNHGGDPREMVEEVKHIKQLVQTEWRKMGIPVHGNKP